MCIVKLYRHRFLYLQYFIFYRFSVVEMKRIYRGFKTECPTGLITEEVFHGIYSRFFPHGGNQSYIQSKIPEQLIFFP